MLEPSLNRSMDAVEESGSLNPAGTSRVASRYVDDDPAPQKRTKRRNTSHLKAVPGELADRERIKQASEEFARSLDKTKPFSRNDLEAWGRKLLSQLGEHEKYLGFAMVLIGNFFWKQQFISIPFERRLLLLPHCLKHAAGCPAEYSQFGLECEKCGACSIADYKVRAEQLGYKVLVAEGSPVVLRIIVEGYVDGILGVACLNVLEKAIDKVLIAGVPSYAVPLHSGDCKNTTLDEAWVWDVLEKYEPLPAPMTRSYVSLMRANTELFTTRFSDLVTRVRSGNPQQTFSPLAQTEEVALEWLANGGKRFRPFITLAAFDAARGGDCVNGTRDPLQAPFTAGEAKVAMAIEAFHKASLVHDDIQDNDLYRYGRQTLHRSHGVGPAINIGDYLIGIGYRLVNEARQEIGAEAACDIIEAMSQAHMKLCDGQGAEMAWQRSPDWKLTPLDALQIYALKTSPAFEAAMLAGMRLAGDVQPYKEMISQFSRQLGVGFQILNDLNDWRGDDDNKLVAGQDALALRPTLLLALALQVATDEQQQALRDVYEQPGSNPVRLEKLRKIFNDCQVFEKASALAEKSRQRAEALADSVESDELRQLLYFFVDTVLCRDDEPTPLEQMQAQNRPLLPIVSVG